MWARFTVLSDTPIASAIEGCAIPLSRSNTIWIRWRCSGCPFQRNAVFKRRIWPLVHLTICSSESDGQSESHPNARMQFTPLFGALLPQTFRFNQLWKRYQVFLIGVKSRNEFQANGAINPCYNAVLIRNDKKQLLERLGKTEAEITAILWDGV